LKTARDLGADCLATGHYVRRVSDDKGQKLLRGADSTKDQSYFLFSTTPEQLDFLRFPLGDFDKKKTRELSSKFGLGISDKPDSQDICFVPNGRYGDVVRRLRPGAVEPGDIMHIDGTVLGQHNGTIDFTIGQRRGLRIGGRSGASDNEGPLYVVEIDTETNKVIVGPQWALACRDIKICDVNWINCSPKSGAKVLAQLRNAAPAVPARAVPNEKHSNVWNLVLDRPQYGIAKGQAAALFDINEEDRLLGGGWISDAPLLNLSSGCEV